MRTRPSLVLLVRKALKVSRVQLVLLDLPALKGLLGLKAFPATMELLVRLVPQVRQGLPAAKVQLA